MLHCRAMTRPFILAGLGMILMGTACDNSERIAKLEKQNQELQEKVHKESRVADYDLASKCSKDARVWFNENWSRDKDTLLLDFTNHYNKKVNKCFIFVEYHYNPHFISAGGNSWTNHMAVYDVYENDKIGEFGENHYIRYMPQASSSDEVIMCEMNGEKCKNIGEFNNLARPYLND